MLPRMVKRARARRQEGQDMSEASDNNRTQARKTFTHEASVHYNSARGCILSLSTSREAFLWISRRGKDCSCSRRVSSKFLFRFFGGRGILRISSWKRVKKRTERKEGERRNVARDYCGEPNPFRLCVGRSRCLQGIGMEFFLLSWFFCFVEMKSSDKVGWSEKDNRNQCAISFRTIDHLVKWVRARGAPEARQPTNSSWCNCYSAE